MPRPTRMIAIMAKAPLAGQAKTRLIPLLGAEGAAHLAQHMLLDSIDLAVEALDGHGGVSLVCPTAAQRATLRTLVPDVMEILAHELGDLMRGLDYGLRHFTQQGYEQVVLLDGDSPTLPLNRLRQAFDALATADVVLGPTLDGGYYLIGSCRPQPELFAWEHVESSTLCRQTQARAEARGARVTLLAPWYDIDTREDVERLVDDLHRQDNGARRTRHFLAQERLL